MYLHQRVGLAVLQILSPQKYYVKAQCFSSIVSYTQNWESVSDVTSHACVKLLFLRNLRQREIIVLTYAYYHSYPYCCAVRARSVQNISISHYQYTISHLYLLSVSGSCVRRAASHTERGHVRSERVRHARDGARARVVRCDRAHGVRRQRGHFLRHCAHAHPRTGPKHAQVSRAK